MMKRLMQKRNRLAARARRVRAKVSGTAECVRLSVFRSNRSLSVQAIDDVAGKTIAAASLSETGKSPKNTVEGAAKVGALIAEKCLKAGVKMAVLDRAGYRYHGKVKALAEAAREAGLQL